MFLPLDLLNYKGNSLKLGPGLIHIAWYRVLRIRGLDPSDQMTTSSFLRKKEDTVGYIAAQASFTT